MTCAERPRGCGLIVVMPVARLLPRWRDVALPGMPERLRCRQCGTRPPLRVEVRDVQGYGTTRVFLVRDGLVLRLPDRTFI